MRVRVAATLLVLAPGALALACAGILGYDELTARTQATNDAEIDTAPDLPQVETEVAPELGLHPPPRPPGPRAPSGKGKTVWLAVKRFYLSTQALGSEFKPDAGLGSTPTSKEAWKDFGYDIDHVCTGPEEAKESKDTCVKLPGTTDTVLVDGNSCRDNNFGSQLVPIVQTFNSVFEDDSNLGVYNGANTFVLKLEDLDDGENDPYVVGKLYRVANIEGYPDKRPKWDGSDVRYADRASLVAGDINTPRAMFTKGYLANNVWVSGEPSKFSIPIPVNTVATYLNLAGAVMTVRLSSSHTAGSLGVLGGAIARNDLEPALRPIARASGVCPDSPLYIALVNTVKKLMDVVPESPTLQDTTAECTGMSVGMGFDFASVQPLTTVVDIPPYPSPCDDAGAGG